LALYFYLSFVACNEEEAKSEMKREKSMGDNYKPDVFQLTEAQ
jgi:hypothetical protein